MSMTCKKGAVEPLPKDPRDTVHAFVPGDKLRLLHPGNIDGARVGDLAVVVDPLVAFPERIQVLRDRCNGDEALFSSCVWVKWIAEPPYCPAYDGAFIAARFELVEPGKLIDGLH